MKTLVVIGALLLILGAIGVIYGGITYTKDKDTVELGPIDVTVQENRHLSIHPAVGAVVAISGVVVLVIGANRKGG